MVTVTALLSYGSTRFRFAAEPSIVVLAAVAADAVLGGDGRPCGERAALTHRAASCARASSVASA